jgi:microcin C transport system permease protein
MNWLDPLTRRRLERFRHHRAGWWSFLALSTLTLLALLGPLLVGNRPLALQIDGQRRFPVSPARQTGRRRWSRLGAHAADSLRPR